MANSRGGTVSSIDTQKTRCLCLLLLTISLKYTCLEWKSATSEAIATEHNPGVGGGGVLGWGTRDGFKSQVGQKVKRQAHLWRHWVVFTLGPWSSHLLFIVFLLNMKDITPESCFFFFNRFLALAKSCPFSCKFGSNHSNYLPWDLYLVWYTLSCVIPYFIDIFRIDPPTLGS